MNPDGFKFMKSAFRRLPGITLFFILLLACSDGISQERIVTAGFQFKPIFSSKFFNTGPQEMIWDSTVFRIEPGSGYCMGMVIRKGYTDRFSVETGINFVRRNYALTISDTSVIENYGFRVIGYEIPLQALIFIQLSDRIFMDVSMGASLDFYPSDIITPGVRYDHTTTRRSWLSSSLLANIGWECRTEKQGYFYLGASYHRPFNYIFRSLFDLKGTAYDPETFIDVRGNYLTADLRYFFHADPQRRKKKMK